jgi:hypothetical protein
MYNTIGVGRLGNRAGKGGRRGVLNNSQYLGSLSTDSEKNLGKEGVSQFSHKQIFAPVVTFKTRENFVLSSIYYRYAMWLGIARKLLGRGVFYS